MKPLKHKAYGSIPHLPNSRLGPGDYHISEGQARIATEKPRDKHDIIIVQEKLDGSNVAIAKINGEILALTRAGYLATSSKYLQHHAFAGWAKCNEKRFNCLLQDGERLCGEWLAMAHGTYYNLHHEPFVAFDLMLGKERFCYNVFEERVREYDFVIPQLLHYSNSSFSIPSAIEAIKSSGHGAADSVEGAIWRVERFNKVDFLCKYVQHFKQDGKYFEELNNGIITWNCDISNWIR